MSCSVFQVSIYGWLSAMDHVGVSGTGESTPTHTVKNGVLRYTLIGVVEEVLFQHPCLASIFSSKIPVECILTLWTNS